MSARSLNKVMLIGNLTRDPNLRFTPNGTAVCSFAVATNRTWTPTDGGDKQQRVDFHNIVAWSRLAEICGQILHKGDKVYLEGRLQTREWKADDGSDRRMTEVVIENMMLLSYKGNNTQSLSEDVADNLTSITDSVATDDAEVESANLAKNQEPKSDDNVLDDIPF